MKNFDKETIAHLLLLMIFAVIMAIGVLSCRAAGTISETISDKSVTDSVSTIGTARMLASDSVIASERDSAAVSSDEHGSIEISRDSAGRPTAISWQRTARLHAINDFHGVTISRMENRRDSILTDIDTFTGFNRVKTSDREYEADPMMPVNRLGMFIVVGVLLFLFAVVVHELVKPWIRKLRSR